jgi:hypothetical protein
VAAPIDWTQSREAFRHQLQLRRIKTAPGTFGSVIILRASRALVRHSSDDVTEAVSYSTHNICSDENETSFSNREGQRAFSPPAAGTLLSVAVIATSISQILGQQINIHDCILVATAMLFPTASPGILRRAG